MFNLLLSQFNAADLDGAVAVARRLIVSRVKMPEGPTIAVSLWR